MRAVNRDTLEVGGVFVWVETWKLRQAIAGPFYVSKVAKRVIWWALGFPLALMAALGLGTICGRRGQFSPLSDVFYLLGIWLVVGGITGLAFEFAALSIQIYKNQVYVIQSYRVFWRLLFSHKTLVRVTPVAPQVTRMEFYSQGRARPKMVRACPFEAAKVVEWFQNAGINVELESGPNPLHL